MLRSSASTYYAQHTVWVFVSNIMQRHEPLHGAVEIQVTVTVLVMALQVGVTSVYIYLSCVL